jgi:hypothetical protein
VVIISKITSLMCGNVVKKGGGGFRLWCVLCAFLFVTLWWSRG